MQTILPAQEKQRPKHQRKPNFSIQTKLKKTNQTKRENKKHATKTSNQRQTMT
jgi:hypothetical protein